jgi:predicted dehydrogenase
MSQLRWGIIGCGDVARKRVAAAIQDDPNSSLLAACRRDRDQLDRFCADFNVENAYTSASDLIDNIDVDAVYIATPVNEHLSQTLLAARVGKHVLVEKPMAMSIDECDQMVEECARQNVTLGVAYYRRFFPVVDRIREIIESGDIGIPMAASVVTTTPFEIQPGDDGSWRGDPLQAGGGSLMDVGSHRLNLLINLFGSVRSVKAHCNSIASTYQTEDIAAVTVQFQSQVVATLISLFGTSADPDEFTIIGTKGRLTSRPLNDGKLEIQIGSDVTTESHPPAKNFSTPLIADFVAAVAEQRKPKVTGEEGRETNEVIERAYINAGGTGFRDTLW